MATDPDGDKMYYFIDWGDGSNSSWLGPYVSGTMIHVNHTWTNKMNSTIRAKAKDILDAESDWGTFTFNCPLVFNPSGSFFAWLFERFPNAFPLLRHLLGYA